MGVSQPGTSSSSFSRPSGGQGKREGSQGAPGVVSRGASSPPAASRSSERGGSVSGLSSAPLPRLSLPIPRRTLDDVGYRERLRRTAPAFYPCVVPDLRIEKHVRIRELVHGRAALVTVAVVLALSPLPVRDLGVESVEGGHRRGRCLPMCDHVEIGRGLRSYRSRRGRSRSRGDRSRSSDRYRSSPGPLSA